MDLSSHLVMFGLNYQRAPLAVREKLSFPATALKESLDWLMGMSGIEGGVILSTCNRSEIYVSTLYPPGAVEQIKQFLQEYKKVKFENLGCSFYCLQDRQVIGHLCKVASGLESQVLGENEILGQVKRAYYEAQTHGSIGTTLEKVFKKAIAVAKKVRSETAITHGSVSLSSMAIKLAERKFNLEGKTILLVGVNKLNEQIARYLYERNTTSVIVANRTYEKAVAIARYLGGRAIHFDQFKKELHRVNLIISSTSAPHLILKKEEVSASLKNRNDELLIIDMAVPRDVDPEVRNLKGVVLYDLDDFKQVIEENLRKKKREVLKAERIISCALDEINFLVEPVTPSYPLHELVS